MLPTYEQAKFLIPDGADTFKFIKRPETTEEDLKKAKEIDLSYFDVYGFHVITNYEEL